MPRLTVLRIDRLPIRLRIFGGFGIVLALLAAVAVISDRGFGIVETESSDVQRMTDAAVAAGDLAERLGSAHALATQYALSENDADLQRAQGGLARLGEALQTVEQSGGSGKAAATLERIRDAMKLYRGSVEAGIAAVGARRGSAVELGKSATELRTIVSAIAGALSRESNPDLVASGLRLLEGFQNSSAAATRFLASRNPADAAMAKTELEAVPREMASLAAATAENRRVQRFLKAMPQPLEQYGKAIDGLLAASERFLAASAERQTHADLLLAAARDLRQASVGAQGEAVDGMVSSVGAARRLGLVTSAVAVVGGLLLAWLIGIGVARPIGGLTAAMRRLAAGELDTEVPHDGRRDEIGEMARAVVVFRENGREVRRLQDEQEELKRRADAERRADMERIAHSFEASVQQVVAAVEAGAESLEANARGMAATAEQASGQSTAVSAASEEAAANVQTVASAAEELSASIAEISKQVGDAVEIAGAATRQAEDTTATIRGLAEMAQRIGEVVQLISDIAGRTNLLALNATIEAARAGEAGKGFAVVASEVKALANQTAKATEDIRAQVQSIQGASGSSVSAIDGIAGTIRRMDEIATTIAAAVEEQGASTGEIARSIQQAAAGTEEVSRNIAGVMHAATETGRSAADVLGATGELKQQAAALQHAVGGFLAAVRAG